MTDNHFIEAAKCCIKGLLMSKYYDVESGKTCSYLTGSDTAVTALNKAIGLGGGSSFGENIGSYWFCDYYPGIRISLWKKDSEEIVTEKVSRALVLKLAEECLLEHRRAPMQLSLF